MDVEACAKDPVSIEIIGPVPRHRLRAARVADACIFFLAGLSFATWAARVPAVKHQVGISDGQLGLALLAAPLGTLVAMQLAGRLSHRYGSGPVTRASVLAVAAVGPLPGLAEDFWQLAAALALFGTGIGFLDTSMNTHAAVLEHEYRRPIMSSFHALYSIGSLVGAGVGAVVARAGTSVDVHFTVAAAVFLVAGVVAGRWLLPGIVDANPRRRGADAPAAPPSSTTSDDASQRAHGGWPRMLVLLGFVALCSFVGEGAASDWSAVYMHDELGTTPAIAASAVACFSLAMAFSRFAGDALTARFGHRGLLRVGGLIAAGGLMATLASDLVWLTLLGWSIFGIGLSAVAPVSFALAAATPGVPRGVAIARVSGVAYVGFMLGPPIIGGLAALVGLRGALLMPVVLALGIAMLAGLLPRHQPQS